MLPIDDAVHRQQYLMACYGMSLACLIEFCAEAPVFVSQVFCFVKLKVIMSTLQILVRSSLFLYLVLGTDGSSAIHSFAWAQLASALTVVAGYYGFYHVYIIRLKKYRNANKKVDNITQMNQKLYGNMDDFPFESILDFMPGVMLKNNVSILKLFGLFPYVLVFSSTSVTPKQHQNCNFFNNS